MSFFISLNVQLIVAVIGKLAEKCGKGKTKKTRVEETLAAVK